VELAAALDPGSDTLFLTAEAICAWSGTQIGTSVFSIA
jgi:hypothetical protein